MKVLLVGGSGHVGTFITPYLRPHHDLRVLDLRPPAHEGLEYVEGSALDEGALRRGLDGVDAFIWLVMRRGQGGSVTTQDVATIQDNYDVNCKGLHLFLYLAQEAGVTRGVYTSTMSVHFRKRERYPGEELVPLDTPSVYGLSKGFGEHICQYFARWFGMSLIALRITGPRTRAQFLEQRRNPRPDPPGTHVGERIFVTDEEDLAGAYHLALEAVQRDAGGAGGGRFDAVYIAGDERERVHNLTKARRLLGWSPRSQGLLEPEP